MKISAVVSHRAFDGMIMSTMLNLLFIPVLYWIIEGWREGSGVKIAEVEMENESVVS